MTTIEEENVINLQLGDIIRIQAPSDEAIHQKEYFIEYVDDETAYLIGIQESDFILVIKKDGTLENKSIIAVELLNRSDTPSYARQNQLLPETWVNIQLSLIHI